jgi:hypothetical protein
VASAALAGLLFLSGAFVLAVSYRHSLSTVRAYENAPITAGTPAVVRKLRNDSGGRDPHHWIVVDGPPSVSGKITLDDSGPVLSRLKQGDRIGVVVWHGHRTDITFHGHVQPTFESPMTGPGLGLGLAPDGLPDSPRRTGEIGGATDPGPRDPDGHKVRTVTAFPGQGLAAYGRSGTVQRRAGARRVVRVGTGSARRAALAGAVAQQNHPFWTHPCLLMSP